MQLAASTGHLTIFASRALWQQHPKREGSERRAQGNAEQRQESDDNAKRTGPRLALKESPSQQ